MLHRWSLHAYLRRGSRKRGRILGRNRDNRFSPCCSQLPLLTDFTPHPLSKSDLKLVYNVNIVYGNLKSENSLAYAQKPQRNCTFMNSALEGCEKKLCELESWWMIRFEIKREKKSGRFSLKVVGFLKSSGNSVDCWF